MSSEAGELEELGIWGIVKESLFLLRAYARLLIPLALTLVLPLCFAILAHNLVTYPLMTEISTNQNIMNNDPDPSVTTPFEARTMRDLAVERSRLFLTFLLYLLFLLAFSLLSTAAFVYAVACAYSGKPLSYLGVISVVPRVWRRLVVTFLWAFLFMFSYQLVGLTCIIILAALIRSLYGVTLAAVFVWPSLALFFGFLIYLSCIWHLASVISVLESTYGLGAMAKSLDLIKGKRVAGWVLFFLYLLCTFLIGMAFNAKVVSHPEQSLGRRAALAVGLILLLSAVTMMGLLVQTVFYFACKAYHLESIDKLALYQHLGAYSGEYMPLRASIQMETLVDP